MIKEKTKRTNVVSSDLWLAIWGLAGLGAVVNCRAVNAGLVDANDVVSFSLLGLGMTILLLGVVVCGRDRV